MRWNWEHPDWPQFHYDAVALAPLEEQFLKAGGALQGAFRHLSASDSTAISAEVMTGEAMATSAIEGEVLDRDSVRASMLFHLGIVAMPRRVPPRERGISELLNDLFHAPLGPLDVKTLFRWHELVMQGSTGNLEIGRYRSGSEPMQIVSGRVGRLKIHFEAPPSDRVPTEMGQFLSWFNGPWSGGHVARAGAAHLYFESIHPFDDGNGRIGRAIAERALAQAFGAPSLIMLSSEIERQRRDYYDQLEHDQRDLEITQWLGWFARTVLDAQARTQSWVDFLIAKSKLIDRLRGRINVRQEQALLRMYREGPDGFTGGLSASKYQTITGVSPATAGRDLSELVDFGALRKTGKGKGTRYWLNDR